MPSSKSPVSSRAGRPCSLGVWGSAHRPTLIKGCMMKHFSCISNSTPFSNLATTEQINIPELFSLVWELTEMTKPKEALATIGGTKKEHEGFFFYSSSSFLRCFWHIFQQEPQSWLCHQLSAISPWRSRQGINASGWEVSKDNMSAERDFGQHTWGGSFRGGACLPSLLSWSQLNDRDAPRADLGVSN